MEITKEIVWENLKSVKSGSPLVHNITNYVVMEHTANALLALGASPIMAHAPDEMDEIVSLSSALVLNIGTLSNHWVDAMEKACEKAYENKIPIVLDPVGTGSTSYRTKVASNFLKSGKMTIVRGNASEIASLASSCFTTKGVDSTCSPEEVVGLAKELANDYKAIICISGANDYVTDGKITYKIANGSSIMAKVTGMGCTASALLGAFLAYSKDLLVSAASSTAIIGIAGELAAENSAGPGSFKASFFDALHNLDELQVNERSSVSLC